MPATMQDRIGTRTVPVYDTWPGAVALLATFDAASDPKADTLYATVLDMVGKTRKGTASKVRLIALAGLDTSLYPSLSKAYAAARVAVYPEVAA